MTLSAVYLLRPEALTNHVGYCIKACKPKTCLQQTKKPGNSIWPARVWSNLNQPTTQRKRLNNGHTVDEFGKDIFATGIIGRGACEHRDRNDDEAGDGPSKSSFRDIRQQRVAECVEQKGNEVIANVDEELMPALHLVVLI